MFNSELLLWHGLLLCALLWAVIVASFFWRPRIWLSDFPSDIQDRVPPMTGDEKRLAVVIGLIVVTIMLSVMVVSTVQYGFAKGYLLAVLHAYLLFQIFNVFDMVVIDWGTLLLINPSNPPIAGTEDASGWRDYRFHALASLKGALLGIPFAASAAGVAWVIATFIATR